MKVLTFPVGFLQTNCYIVADEHSRECFVIDCGDEGEYLQEKIDILGLSVKAILLTHGHADHISAVQYFADKGIPVYVGKDEKDMVEKGLHQVSLDGNYETFKPTVLVEDGQVIEIAGMKIKVVSTPGHTKGGVCYIVENSLFAGDTLFLGSYGRTDLGGGNFNELVNSIKKLFALDGDYDVYPGHDAKTTLNFERKNNMLVLNGDIK